MAQRRPTADSSQVPMKGFWDDPLTGFRRSETTGDNAAAGPGCLKTVINPDSAVENSRRLIDGGKRR